MATMLLRLTDDDPVGAISGDQALEQKFSDVAMLFSALDGHLARVMFGKLARAVLALDAGRRTALLRRTILPGLLDGRADGAVLRDFPDPDLAESLCLLMELEAAAPEVRDAALHRLDLPGRAPPDRRRRSWTNGSARAAAVTRRTPTRASTASRAGWCRSRRRRARASRNSRPSICRSTITPRRRLLDTRRTHRRHRPGARRSSIACGGSSRLEPNPALVKPFMQRALESVGELDRAARWHDLAVAAARYRQLDRRTQSRAS